MKKYINPIIKAIKLDSKQAILEACAIGGLYLNDSWCGHTSIPSPMGPTCLLTPKGGAGGSTYMKVTGGGDASTLAAPS